MHRPRFRRRFAIGLASAAGLVAGCSSEPEPRQLGAEQFYRPADRGGAIPVGPQATPPRNAPSSLDVPSPAAAAVEPGTDPLKFVTQQVKAALPTPSTAPSQLPAPAPAPVVPASFEVGQYLSVGAIIAEVNGTPIYADEVVRSITPLLSARAKDLDEQPFRSLASTEIGRQVDDMIRTEVEYASAERNTSADDKSTADRITQQWRDRLKTENKGSIEEVRRKYREQGRTFDEAAKEQYRLNLVRVYYTKKLFPRIQVTADDLRRYYDQNRESLFTQRDNLTFRLIKITPAAMGSDALAKAKADELAARIGRGEDFATIAGEINHDPTLLKTKGLVGPIDRGAYVLDDVENALWKVSPGDTTPVLHVGDAYYLAHLESKKLGRTMAFEEDAVQKRMLDALRSSQFGKMRTDMEQQLRRDSVISKNQSTYAVTLAMAMQNYGRWHG